MYLIFVLCYVSDLNIREYLCDMYLKFVVYYV